MTVYNTCITTKPTIMTEKNDDKSQECEVV